jgi:hypothetical protein
VRKVIRVASQRLGLSLALALGTASTLPVIRLGHPGGVLGALGLVTLTILAVATISALSNAVAPLLVQPPQTATQAAGADTTASATPTSAPTPAGGTGAADEQGILRTLSNYFDAVNNRDYDTAWAQYTAQEQARNGSEQQYVQGESTTHVSNTMLHGVVQQSPGVDLATFTFTSTQSPANSPDGQVCDNWSLVYTMVATGNTWLIDNAVGENGVAYRPC